MGHRIPHHPLSLSKTARRSYPQTGVWSALRIIHQAALIIQSDGRFLQFAIMPAMMIDVHDNHRNRTGAGRHRRSAATSARGQNHVAAYISCAAASQLPALLLGTVGLAHWHVDATDRDELVRLPDHQ